MSDEPHDALHELTRACLALREEIDAMNVRVDRIDVALSAHADTAGELAAPLAPELEAALVSLRNAVRALLDLVALACGTA